MRKKYYMYQNTNPIPFLYDESEQFEISRKKALEKTKAQRKLINKLDRRRK